MVQVFLAVLGALRVFFRSRSDTALEILALRQQVAVLKRQRPRPPLNSGDPLLLDHPPPLLVPPDRCPPDCPTGDRRRLASAGCRLYWRWRSRGGRPSVTQELRDLIARLAEENPDWGAPKIHGELQKLGFTIAERTVARYLRRILHRGDPKRKWLAFLQNHREVIAAMDFFTVPTVTFRVLHCFFVIEHERRKLLHSNVTHHPTAEWIVQQLREAFPEPCRYRYVILDRDRKFDAEVVAFLTTAGLEAKRTSVRSPWQNGLAERWIESCRREILDQVIPFNEGHLRRILRDYVRYFHEDRLHDSLEKDAPNRRIVEHRPGVNAKVVSIGRLGGLHHRYSWNRAA